MAENRRATFSKAIIENGGKPKTFYSFQLERLHWIAGTLASIAAVVLALLVLRGAVYASVQDVAAAEFKRQLDTFHTEVQPVIRTLIDDRISNAQNEQAVLCQKAQHEDEMLHAKELSAITEALGRLDTRLESIDGRLNRLELIR